jgi:hypothetical protein
MWPRSQGTDLITPGAFGYRQLINIAKEIGGIGYPLTYVGAFTGVRRNEALSLQVSDVEWFAHEIHVRHAISKQRSSDGAHKWEWQVGPPSPGNQSAASGLRKV